MTQGCVTAGPHYNPHNKKHGFIGEDRPVGDLGNLKARENVIFLLFIIIIVLFMRNIYFY